jgi:hypothetical protein
VSRETCPNVPKLPRLENLARAKQTLPNGYCGLPQPNACLTCDSFLTTGEFLPQHRDQLTRTERLIAQAEADGRQRLVEMNEASSRSPAAPPSRTTWLYTQPALRREIARLRDSAGSARRRSCSPARDRGIAAAAPGDTAGREPTPARGERQPQDRVGDAPR